MTEAVNMHVPESEAKAILISLQKTMDGMVKRNEKCPKPMGDALKIVVTLVATRRDADAVRGATVERAAQVADDHHASHVAEQIRHWTARPTPPAPMAEKALLVDFRELQNIKAGYAFISSSLREKDVSPPDWFVHAGRCAATLEDIWLTLGGLRKATLEKCAALAEDHGAEEVAQDIRGLA